MEICSIGFTKKTAEQFFSILKREQIRRLLDVRLNNVSQLAGFAKREDLKYFLKEICDAEYVHEPLLAPTSEMLTKYKKEKGDWGEYETKFLRLMAERKIEKKVDGASFSVRTVLLCSEAKADHCHRRLVLEYLQDKWSGFTIRHL
ncbi:MAG TPA: DUF488 domain-containing protein [Candidatus Dormibacteraeota bacterium]|nr:DUF488 domain-containing protein [Candidatus Dormibacteraeota bacterium]